MPESPPSAPTEKPNWLAFGAGILLLILGILLLSWHETKAVQSSIRRNLLHDEAIEISPDSWNKVNNGRLVYLTGTLKAITTLEDPEFNVTARALRMKRTVEMFQWVEKNGSSPSYEKTWSPIHHDPSEFTEPAGHENPTHSIPHGPWSGVTYKAGIGSFLLSQALIRDYDHFIPWSPLEHLPPEGLIWSEGYMTSTPESSEPRIGDIRISYEIVPEGPVTVVAEQAESELVPWNHAYQQDFYLIASGTLPLAVILSETEDTPIILPQIIRAVVWVILCIGAVLMISTFVSMRVRNKTGALNHVVRIVGVGLASMLMSLLISIAWIGRYLDVGILFLLLMLGIGGFLFWFIRRNVKLT